MSSDTRWKLRFNTLAHMIQSNNTQLTFETENTLITRTRTFRMRPTEALCMAEKIFSLYGVPYNRDWRKREEFYEYEC